MTTKDEEDTEVSGKAIDLAASTLTGDIRDFLLDRIKHQGKPWPAMSEQEQRDQINAAKSAAEALVKKACEIIAADGRKSMKGTLDSITVKDGIKAVIKLSKTDESRHELLDSAGRTVLVVVADAEMFTGESGPATPEPDQGDLIGSAERLKKENGKVTPLR